MANHAHVARLHAKLLSDRISGSIVVEGEREHRSLSCRQTPQAMLETIRVERLGTRIDGGLQVSTERIEQLLTAVAGAPPVDDELATRSENVRSKPLRFAHRAGAQLLQREQQHVLDQIGRGSLVAEVSQTVEAHPRHEAPAKL